MPPSEQESRARRRSGFAFAADFLGILGFCGGCLGCAESKLTPVEPTRDVPTDTQRLQSLEGENRKLVDRLAEVTAERDALKAGRAPAAPCSPVEGAAVPFAEAPASPAPPANGASISGASASAATVSAEPAAPPSSPSRIAIVVEGEEPGRIIEMQGDESLAPNKDAPPGAKRKATGAKAKPESSSQKR